MDTDTNLKWYSRLTVADVTEADLNNPSRLALLLSCPRCGYPFPFSPLFDHHPNRCRKCNAALVEWNMTNYIYLIDKDNAPPVVAALIAHTALLPEPEAEQSIRELLRFLGVQPII